MAEPLKIALLGCGRLSEILAERVFPRVREAVEVVAAIDVRRDRAERLAASLNVPAFESLEEALGTVPVEAVDIRLPHHLHLIGVEEATQLRRHVLVEKPMAMTVADCHTMSKLAADAGVTLAVGESHGFVEGVHVAKELIADGAIGPLLVLETARVFELGEPWRRDGWRTARGNAAGILAENSCHMSRMLRSVATDIDEVFAYARTGHPDWLGEDTAVVSLRFKDGLIGQQLYCWASPTSQASVPELSAYGSRGSIHVYIDYEGSSGGTVLRRPGVPDQWYATGTNYYDALAAVLVDFSQACRSGTTPIASASDGTYDVSVLEAIYASVRTGLPVKVERSVA